MRSDLEPVDIRTWLFEETARFHLDSCQKAKAKVTRENDDVNYRDLRARVVEYYSTSIVVVVEAKEKWSDAEG